MGISKRGNKYLRKLMIHGARAALPHVVERDTPLGRWIKDLLARVHPNVAVVALDLPYAKVNPRQSRRFAEVTGRLAKTDRVDDIMLAKMGAMLGLQRQEPPSDEIVDLREFLAARRALMKNKVAAKTRLQTTTQDLLRRQIRASFHQLNP